MRTRDEILASLDWSKPREIPTKRGPRNARSAPATDEAIALFDRERDELYKIGFSIAVFRGETTVSEWKEAGLVKIFKEKKPRKPRAPKEKDPLAKTNIRDLIRRYTPRGPIPGFLFGRTPEECWAIMEHGWNDTFTGPKTPTT